MPAKWPRVYVVTPDMQWVMVVSPNAQTQGALDFAILRDGWSLMEASLVPPVDRPLDDWIRTAIGEMSGHAFHVKFHDHAREYGHDVPGIEECAGDCPWRCPRGRVMELCLNRWGFLIPSVVRKTGCGLFLKRQEFAQAGA